MWFSANDTTKEKRTRYSTLISSFLTFIIPKFCVSCGEWGEFLCYPCSKNIFPVYEQTCFVCNSPSDFGFTHPFCKKNNSLDGVQILYTYNKITRSLIHAVKYKNIRHATMDLLKSKPNIYVSFTFLKKNEDSAFIPIPLSQKRLLTRGYNQAEDISNYFRDIFSLPVLSDVLIRIKETKAQSTLKSATLRKENMKNAFYVTSQSQLPDICILVDDITTSGSTLMEAGKILKENGVKKVYAITLTGVFRY